MGTHGGRAGHTGDDVLGWGGFTSVLAGGLVLATGSGWRRAALVLGLGAAATLLLWLAGRVSGRPVAPRRPPAGSGPPAHPGTSGTSGTSGPGGSPEAGDLDA